MVVIILSFPFLLLALPGLNHLPSRWPLTIVVNEEGGFALEVDGASRLGSKCETGALVLATVIASEFSTVGIDRNRGCFVCGRGKLFPATVGKLAFY